VSGHKFSLHFLVTEWEQIVDAWQLASWDDYRDVTRLGRKTRLPEPQRAVLWAIFEQVRSALAAQKLITHAGMFTGLATTLAGSKHPPYDFAVVDEAQDLSVAHLRFLAALGAQRPDALFFAGDLGQRIFQQPFSWKSLGVDIRGRSRTLRINYRTSHQIRQQADRLLGEQTVDVDGNADTRSDTVSVFNGPPPVIRVLKTEDEEIKRSVPGWLSSPQPVSCRRSLACLSGQRRNWSGREKLSPHLAYLSRCWMSMSRLQAAMCRSSPCTWPKGWSFAPWS
jgi:hypothetical protein